MDYVKVNQEYISDLKLLQICYKEEIGEERPGAEDFENLLRAINNGQILFYGCLIDGKLVACCSVTPTFSTFNYKIGGVFEDFYILPEYRHKGIARKLVQFAYRESGVSSLTVGCADCDVEMYKSLGFTIALGNMYAYDC